MMGQSRRQKRSDRLELRESGPGKFSLEGNLNFFSVNRALQNTKQLFRQQNAIEIDLKGVVNSDSAGVALLLEWMREAYARNRTITFQNVPQQIIAIATISGLDAIILGESRHGS